MAAGMASRYGSMKQIQQFGPSGETIMDYSIYDAIKAGFGKVVFIIRRDFAEDFKTFLSLNWTEKSKLNTSIRNWIRTWVPTRFRPSGKSPGEPPMLFFVPAKR
jgi:hypothetical protein